MSSDLEKTDLEKTDLEKSDSILKLDTIGKAYIISGERTRLYKDSIKQYAVWSREHRGWLIPKSRGELARDIYNLILNNKVIPSNLKTIYHREVESKIENPHTIINSDSKNNNETTESLNELKNHIINLETLFNAHFASLDLAVSKFEEMFKSLDSRISILEDFSDTTTEIINNMK